MLAQRNLPIIEMAEYLFHLDVIATSDTIIPSPSITTTKKDEKFQCKLFQLTKTIFDGKFLFCTKGEEHSCRIYFLF